MFPLEEKDSLLQELDATREQLQNLLKRHEELETKSRSDIKVLVKEVKSLRYSQTELKQELSQSIKEKSEAEVVHHTTKSHILLASSSCNCQHFTFKGPLCIID